MDPFSVENKRNFLSMILFFYVFFFLFFFLLIWFHGTAVGFSESKLLPVYSFERRCKVFKAKLIWFFSQNGPLLLCDISSWMQRIDMKNILYISNKSGWVMRIIACLIPKLWRRKKLEKTFLYLFQLAAFNHVDLIKLVTSASIISPSVSLTCVWLT